MCIDVGDAFDVIQMWECNEHRDQNWGYDSKSMSVYPQSSGETRCLDLDHGQVQQGTHAILFPCFPGTGEAWLLALGREHHTAMMANASNVVV